MRMIYKISAALLVVVALSFVASAAFAVACTPSPNGAAIHLKIWNDSPMSTATADNSYPVHIGISDIGLAGCGWANLHNWSFSEDLGASWATFNNCSAFRYASDVQIEGNLKAEAGLRLSPWWGKESDGKFMVNTDGGEIACFGGRLPFYSFTGNYGLHYTLGEEVRMEIIYNPNGLSSASPATITYNYIVSPYLPGEIKYSSGPLPFDEGNPGEDPPYGLWGMLNDGRVGGYFQPRADCGNMDAKMRCSWDNIVFQGGSTTPVAPTTWGGLKKQYK